MTDTDQRTSIENEMLAALSRRIASFQGPWRSLYAAGTIWRQVVNDAGSGAHGRRWKPNSYPFFRACDDTGEELMNRRTTSMLAGVTIAALPALAAEVTPERLINADREPQNWLMNHRTYDAQRYSPLDKINSGNVKDLNEHCQQP